MKNGSVRKILLVAAGSVFLLSSVMVSKYRLELDASADFAENLAQMVVTPYEAPPVSSLPDESAAVPGDIASPDMAAGTLAELAAGGGMLHAAGENAAGPTDVVAPGIAAKEIVTESGSRLMLQAAGESAAGPAGAAAPNAAAEKMAETVSGMEMQAAAAGSGEPADAVPTQAPVPVRTVRKSSRVAPIKVDFEALRAQNPDVVGWLYCPDTPINYPVVQTDDNEYYMHRRLDGSRSYPGTLFVDFRNSVEFTDWNSLIYGHNMRNDSMFGTLPYYTMGSYFKAHPEIYLLTPEYDYLIDVMGGFVTPGNSELYNSLNPDDPRKEQLLKSWLPADIAPEDYPTPEDRLVTLSTCTYAYKDSRYALIGILVELGN